METKLKFLTMSMLATMGICTTKINNLCLLSFPLKDEQRISNISVGARDKIPAGE